MLRLSTVSALAATAALAGTLQAQGGTLARSYLIAPKPGMHAQFEAALSSHAVLRRGTADPWSWSVFTVETGRDAGAYFIMSGGHSWADLDAYDANIPFQEKVGDHWNTTVAPLVAQWSSMITRTDTSLSSNNGSNPDSLAFANVTEFRIRPGMERPFFAAIRQAHQVLAAAKWKAGYSWAYPMSGYDDQPVAWLVTFHTGWADMEAPSPTFEQVMVARMGEAGFTKWNEQFNATLRGSGSMTLRFRPGLSVLR